MSGKLDMVARTMLENFLLKPFLPSAYFKQCAKLWPRRRLSRKANDFFRETVIRFLQTIRELRVQSRLNGVFSHERGLFSVQSHLARVCRRYQELTFRFLDTSNWRKSSRIPLRLRHSCRWVGRQQNGTAMLEWLSAPTKPAIKRPSDVPFPQDTLTASAKVLCFPHNS